MENKVLEMLEELEEIKNENRELRKTVEELKKQNNEAIDAVYFVISVLDTLMLIHERNLNTDSVKNEETTNDEESRKDMLRLLNTAEFTSTLMFGRHNKRKEKELKEKHGSEEFESFVDFMKSLF